MDGRGHAFVIGTTGNQRYEAQALIQKHATDTGHLLWERAVAGVESARIHDAALDSAGDLLILAQGSVPPVDTPSGVYVLIKVNAADGSVAWQRRGTPVSPRFGANSPRLTVDAWNNVIIATASSPSPSTSHPCYLAKYQGADGSLLWERYSSRPYESPTALVCDARGDIVVASSWRNPPPIPLHSNPRETDFIVTKHDSATGEPLWERVHNGPGNGYDDVAAMVASANGDIVVTGTSSSSETWGNEDFYTAKYAGASGDVIWERRSSHPEGRSFASGLALDAEGHVVVTGLERVVSGSSDDSINYTAKFAAADGAILWERRFAAGAMPELPGSSIHSRLAVDATGDVIVARISQGRSYALKYAGADGALRWERQGPEPGTHTMSSLSLGVDPDGDILLAGTDSVSPGASLPSQSADIFLTRYAAADGVPRWENRYDGPLHTWAETVGVALDASGHVAVAGYSIGNANLHHGRSDMLTAKMSAATGEVLWQRIFNGAANSHDEARAVAMDAAGNVVVTGVVTSIHPDDVEWSPPSARTHRDFYTARYAAADGALLWERTYDGPATVFKDDEPAAMALDSNGNVLVTGFSPGVEGYVDYYTAKYAAADGSLLWERRSSGPGSGADYPVALAVDAANNVIVTGTSHNESLVDEAWHINSDIHTVKYAGSDGAVLWEKRYDSGSDDRVTGLAVDSAGHVAITGSVNRGMDGSDIYTAKYAGGTGNLIWERHYSAPGRSADEPFAIAMSPAGDVLVTGVSQPVETGSLPYAYPTVTLRYGSADGALVWERSSATGVPDTLIPSALAIDGADHFMMAGRQYMLLQNSAAAVVVVSVHSLADGKRLAMHVLGNSSRPTPGLSKLPALPTMTVDGSGRIAVTGGVFSSGPIPEADPMTALFHPVTGMPSPLSLVSLHRMPPHSWNLSGKGAPDQVYALEFSPDLSEWTLLGLLASDARGNISFDHGSNQASLYLRLAAPP